MQGSTHKAEALIFGGDDQRMRAAVDGGEVLVGDVPGEGHVGELVRPGAGGADEHERQLSRLLAQPRRTSP